MGIYVLVSLTLACDTCGTEVGKILTAKDDVPLYASATITCMPCIASGVKHPSGSTDKSTVDFVNQYVTAPQPAQEK